MFVGGGGKKKSKVSPGGVAWLNGLMVLKTSLLVVSAIFFLMKAFFVVRMAFLNCLCMEK